MNQSPFHNTSLSLPAAIRQSLRAVMGVYREALSQYEIAPEDFWVVFLLGEGPLSLAELRALLMFAVAEPQRAIQQTIQRGWIEVDGRADEDQARLTERWRQITEQLMPTAQDVNAHWRGQLADAAAMPLEAFLAVLQGVGCEPSSRQDAEPDRPPQTTIA